MPSSSSLRDGLRADARDEAGGGLREPKPCALGGQLEEAVRLLGVRRDLRHQLVGADADAAGEPGLGLDGLLDGAGRGAVPVEPGEVEVRLVEAHDLDALHVPPQDRHDLLGAGAVRLEVGRDEHRIRAQPARPLGGRGGEDAIPARLIAGGRDDGPRPAAGHHDGQPAQLRPALKLDAHIEGVHVHVSDPHEDEVTRQGG